MLKQIIAGISVVVLLFSVGAVWVQAEDGVTDKVIHIGQTGPLSGPAKLWGGSVKGVALRIALENEKGGVHGRKIEHHVYDDAYNPARTKAGVKRLQERVGMFAWVGTIGTANALAVKDYLMNRDIPWVGPFTGSDAMFDPPEEYLFTIYSPYTFEIDLLFDYAVKELGKKRVAIVYQDDSYGHTGLAGARQALQRHDLSLVAEVPIKLKDIDMSKAVAELRQAEADAVLIWISPFTALHLMKVAEKMNYEPQWLGSSTLSMFSVFYKLSRGLVEGLITPNFQTDDQAKLDYVRQAHDRLDPEEPFSTAYMLGFAVGDLLVEGLQRCGPDPTRQGLVKALEGINADNYQSFTKAFTYEPFDPDDPMCRLGTRELFLQQCMAGGKAKKITGWASITDYWSQD
ncbi:MAG: ABC transporter substrate-binding protein [Desulfosudaceae bacterium]